MWKNTHVSVKVFVFLHQLLFCEISVKVAV